MQIKVCICIGLGCVRVMWRWAHKKGGLIKKSKKIWICKLKRIWRMARFQIIKETHNSSSVELYNQTRPSSSSSGWDWISCLMRARDSDRGCYSIGTAIKLSFGAEITLLLQDHHPPWTLGWCLYFLQLLFSCVVSWMTPPRRELYIENPSPVQKLQNKSDPLPVGGGFIS